MKTLHIDVRDKIATYHTRDGEIVCGNKDYQVEFSLDAEWEGLDKTARFIWNGQYFDVPLLADEDTCAVPVISNAKEVTVGLYAKEVQTTTSATIGCKPSILCGGVTPNPGYGANYTTEAQAAAKSAKASADSAKASAAEARAAEAYIKEEFDLNKMTRDIKENRYRIQDVEKKLGYENVTYEALDITNGGTIAIPEKSMKYAAMTRLEGHISEYSCYNGAVQCFVKNYPNQVVADDGAVVFDFDKYDGAYAVDIDFGIEGNYFYMGDDDTFRYYKSRKHVAADYELEAGESIYREFYMDGVVTDMIINLAEPTTTKASGLSYYDSINTNSRKSLTAKPKYTAEQLSAIEGCDLPVYVNAFGKVTITFELR